MSNENSGPKYKVGDVVKANGKSFPDDYVGQILTITGVCDDDELETIYHVKETLIRFYEYELDPYPQAKTKLWELI